MKRKNKKQLNMQNEIIFPNTKQTFADFFAGCGGFSLGLIQAGLKCVSALEFNDDAAWTYWHNLCYKGWSHLWMDPENQKLIDKVKKRWGNAETTNHLWPNGVEDNWLTSEEPMPCLNLFLIKVWWASTNPNSHGNPAWRIELIGDAPVPPSKPEIKIWSALALVTPEAMVPTPALDTNFTEILAWRLAFFKSKINCAKSSME